MQIMLAGFGLVNPAVLPQLAIQQRLAVMALDNRIEQRLGIFFAA